MSKYGFSVARTFPYKDRIIDSVLIRKIIGQRNPVYRDILRSANKILSKVFCTVTVTSAFRECKTNGLSVHIHPSVSCLFFLCWFFMLSFILIQCVKSVRFWVTLVRIFPHSDWIRRDTKHLSVFTPNVKKCVKKRTRITPNTDTFCAVTC